jgi:hypothetical protein
MISEIFPGLGGLFRSATCVCVCGCTPDDPAADDTKDDKDDEGKAAIW